MNVFIEFRQRKYLRFTESLLPASQNTFSGIHGLRLNTNSYILLLLNVTHPLIAEFGHGVPRVSRDSATEREMALLSDSANWRPMWG